MEAAFDIGDLLAEEPAPAQPHQIQADQPVSLRRQRKGRDIPADTGSAADHRTLADAAALVHKSAPAEHDEGLHPDMPREKHPVDQHDPLAQPAVVGDMAVGHQKATRPDPGQPPGCCRPMDGDALAHHGLGTHQDARGHGGIETEILGIAPQNGTGIDHDTLLELRACEQRDPTEQPASGGNPRPSLNPAEGSNLGGGVDLGPGFHDGSRMDWHGKALETESRPPAGRGKPADPHLREMPRRGLLSRTIRLFPEAYPVTVTAPQIPIAERLKIIDQEFRAWLQQAAFLDEVAPPLLREAVLAYPARNAKRMRPAMILLAAGATGGAEGVERARAVAWAVELFHTWTLVHDDVIDRDLKRRGQPTVHAWAAEQGAAGPLKLEGQEAAHYGATVAILAGDLQQGWCNDTILASARNGQLPSGLALEVLFRMNRKVLTLLVQGEMLDVDYGLLPLASSSLPHEDAIVRMLWQKTGALYEFCGETGALLGIGSGGYDAPAVRHLGAFASHLGTAFQLQDDVLGVVGSERETGKPVGADLREGKKTTLVLRALRTGPNDATRNLRSILGNKEASTEGIELATRELEALGAIEHTRALAKKHLDLALAELGRVAESPWRDALAELAAFTLSRSR